eukprot:g59.t1
MTSNHVLARWLDSMTVNGFSVVTGAPLQSGSATALASRISFVRRTFWGNDWKVKAARDFIPQNLSLTSNELLPHTDFSWAEVPPGLQLLHCLQNRRRDGSSLLGGTNEGLSTLCDGFAVAKHLRKTDPQSFLLLTKMKVPFEFQGDGPSLPSALPTFFRHRGAIIETSIDLCRSEDSEEIVGIRFNEANRGALDCPSYLMENMFHAIQTFHDLCTSDVFSLKFQLQEGQILVFNNRRLLHGRDAYDASSVERELEGCYIDAEEVYSRQYSLRREFPVGHPC